MPVTTHPHQQSLLCFLKQSCNNILLYYRSRYFTAEVWWSSECVFSRLETCLFGNPSQWTSCLLLFSVTDAALTLQINVHRTASLQRNHNVTLMMFKAPACWFSCSEMDSNQQPATFKSNSLLRVLSNGVIYVNVFTGLDKMSDSDSDYDYYGEWDVTREWMSAVSF